MANENNYPRLGVKYDPTGLNQAEQSAKRATDALRQVGQAANAIGAGSGQSAAEIAKMARELATMHGATEKNVAAARQLQQQLLDMGRAAAGSNARITDMAAALSKTGRNTSEYRAILSELQQAQHTATKATEQVHSSATKAAGGFSLLQAAAGGAAAAIGFQLMNNLTSLGHELAAMPMRTARAQDALTVLSAKLKFAFNNSSEAARQARKDIEALAERSGISYGALSNQYAEIAISGRGMGLGREQVTGLTRAFSTLGQMTGADERRIAGAMWQFQQAMSIGRLTSQDYRFMATNMPAIDDALAAGMGVDVNKIPGMVSRGEISADRMIEGLTRGVEILSRTAGGLPETMERSKGRLITQWELLLQELGDKLKTSDFFQSLDKLSASAVKGARALLDDSLERQIVQLQQQKMAQANRGFPSQGIDDEIAKLKAQIVQRDAAAAKRASEQAKADAENQERAKFRRGLQIAEELDPLARQRGELQQQRGQITTALANATGQSADDVERLNRALASVDARLGNIMTVFQRRVRDARRAAADFENFGGGADFDIAQQARGIMDSAVAEGPPISFGQARSLVFNERLTSAWARTSADIINFQIARKYATAGLDPRAARAAGVELQTAQFAQQFGQFADTDEAKAAIAAARAQFQKASDAEVEDAIKNRQRDQEANLRDLKEEMGLRRRLGIEGQVQLAQLRAMQELRKQGLDTNQQAVAAELARTEQLVRATDELEKQNRAFDRLQQAADALGSGIRRTFSGAIREAFEEGAVSAKTVMRGIASTAEEITNRIFERMVIDKAADRATNFFEGILGNIFGSGKSASGSGGMNHAFGGAFGSARPFGLGGVSQTPTLFSMANGMGLAFEAGAEAVMPLKRGPDGRLGVAAQGGGSVNVINIHDHRSNSNAEAVDVQTSRGGDGMEKIDIYIRDKVRSGIRSGEYDGAMKAQYGASRVVAQR